MTSVEDRPVAGRAVQDPADPTDPRDPADDSRRVLGSSAVMAAGTVVSRASGFVRSALLAAALGVSLHADVFNIANTVPNMLYILLAGGVFNAVLVPQLVRALKTEPDGGEAYTNRVVTLAALFLGTVSVLLVVAAPTLMSLFLTGDFSSPELSAQRQSVVDLARFCLPQVFFYGMFVLVGQILNARGRFGPMMWAPIANNVISVAVLVAYLLSFGAVGGAGVDGAYSASQERLLGIGSTVGIAVQLIVLVPYLRAAGYRFRPRFDFVGTGLSHTLRLGVWTVLFVVVNQVAYTVVVRLASGGTSGGATDGTGYTIYSQAFLIVMVPHSVVTVSLSTAVLPALSRRAAAGDLRGLAASLSATLRTALAVVVPFVALLPLVASYVAQVIWGHGAAADAYTRYVPTLSLFGVGLLFFTCHYLVLRGFYALEATRTVFWIQCAVAATNIVAALVAVSMTDAAHTAPALVGAYTVSYAVGAAVSYVVLQHRVGDLGTARLLRFVVRLVLVVAVSTSVAAVVAWVLHRAVDDPSWVVAAGLGAVVAAVDVVLFVAGSRLVRLREVDSVLATFGLGPRRPYPSHRGRGKVLP